MEALEQRIRYRFKQPEHLVEALTHSSYGYENQTSYNERLEFLGDAILGYVISKALFLRFPKEPEGVLSKMKSVLVSAPFLAKKARDIGLGENLRLGKGENKAGGRRKPSILADAMEAVIGAIALDGGMEEAESFINLLFEEDVQNASLEIKNAVDFKTLLQERLQEYGLGLPKYVLDREEGPAHNRRFCVHVEIADYKGPSAVGTSKKNAQQECARKFIEERAFWERYESKAATTND